MYHRLTVAIGVFIVAWCLMAAFTIAVAKVRLRAFFF